jgi:acetyltransferase-like isoleucine patch superfamily enzyme
MINVLIAIWMWAWVWVLPATLAAGVLALLVALLKWAGISAWYVWLLLAPSLYACWLVSFLFFCARSMKHMGRKGAKPRQAMLPGSPMTNFRTVLATTLRKGVVDSLPLRTLVEASGGKLLSILASSPSVQIGKDAMLPGDLKDADLIELGDHVTLGGGAMVSAHVWTTLPSGKRMYITAPVKIGSRVTVGANSTIMLGCTIGDDVLIQPHSCVPPHTEVPAGEIWGGCPAVFIGKRRPAKEAEGASTAA